MKIVLFLLLVLNLHADIKQEMLGLYQNSKFNKVCKIGFRNFKNHNKDEEFVSLYAFACLKSDYIDRLAVPTAMLKHSKEARSNSAYFSIILMQKKLLYHALVDGYDLAPFTLPSTDYVLSKVFTMYAKIGKHKAREFYLFEDPKNDKVTYKLYLAKGTSLKKIIIEEFYNSKSMQRHVYW